ncbi:ATP/GTP-binding protein [Neptuniibacter sp. CAU 1671]|uniref:GTP-binding protein n=1 Tax=Neptuniibacter sp. CAU 1671 TaxID=3032593 RepID=UPI0023D9CEEC|nr:ATP/GTP-binding protein [Neptuniibacter sp. CAU 1671]MDF2182320.1 ATP/GTP-binding protein [Neptuniibacter sp. CAU 1671]
MKDFKVLFTGSVASGKTTAIRSLSDIDTVDTDANVSDSAIRRKRTTTIAMDYGVLELDDTARMHLYGTPGQERFKFMWELMMSDLAHDAIGMILLVDNTRKDPFRDIKFYLEEFRDFIVRRRMIIAVTHSDLRAEPDLQHYQRVLKDMGVFTTVMFIDARVPSSVLGVLQELVGTEVAGLDWEGIGARLDSKQPELPQEDEEPAALNQVPLLQAAVNTRGITSAMYLDAERKIVDSTIKSEIKKELLCSMANLISALEKKAAFMGSIDNLVLCGEGEETLSVFVDTQHALGLCSEPNLTLNVLKQQAADLLQWSNE